MISIIKKKQNKKIRNISFLNILQFFNNNGKYFSNLLLNQKLKDGTL